MEKKNLNFGLIGCGVISKTHFSAISSLPNTKLVAVCDTDEGRAKTVGDEQGVEWYSDHKALLEREDVDVVAICTPHGTHAEIGIDAANAGKHALMEKPLTLNSEDAEKLLEAFKKNNKKIFSVIQVRYNPTILALKKIIDNNKLGKINNAALVVRWYRPDSYFVDDGWRGTLSQDGGLLFSQGIHYVDILRWLMGPVKSVYGKAMIAAHDIEMDDLVIANIEFANSAMATLEIGLCTYPKNLECSLIVMGKKGTVKIAGSALNEIAAWEVDGMPQPELEPCVKPNVYKGGQYQGSCPNHVFVYKDLINDLINGTSLCTDGEEAKKAMELSEAIYKSSKSGNPTFLQ
ncbi:Gfo/Idh/MocA family oxidoreductase [bacterium]|nr:Gfo/Idh/MocA family oxidoreductase [bacterium]